MGRRSRDAEDEPMECSRPEAKRYRYTEYVYGSNRVSLIQDAENENAWIQSTGAVPVER